MAEDEAVTPAALGAETESDETASAETETTEKKSETKESRIPYERFEKVIGQKNDALRRVEELEAKLKALATERESGTDNLDADGDEGPPAGMSQKDQVKWYVEHYSDAMIRRKLGMPLERAKELLETGSKTREEVQAERWVRMCGEYGIEPTNVDAQKVIAGLIRGGDKPEEAFKKAAQWLGKKPPPSARIETDSVSGTLTETDWLPATEREALEGAHKGRKAKQLSSVEIIRRSMDKEAARSR